MVPFRPCMEAHFSARISFMDRISRVTHHVSHTTFHAPRFTHHATILLALSLMLLLATTALVSAADTNSLLNSWLGAQTNIQTWASDFVQTRTFKSLTQPLTATGHVWFAAPNRFHWELGNPPQTIAVRATNEMLVLYPRLKRVERYPLTGNRTGPWQDALALLEAGFPRSQAQLESN